MEDELVCLGPCATQGALGIIARASRVSLGVRRRGLGVGRRDARLLELCGELRPLSLCLPERSLERPMQLREMRVRPSEDRTVQAETLGDGEGVRRAGQTEVQPERRPQCLRVELHARVAHSRRAQRERFELRVVRRRRHQDAALAQRFEHRHGEGRSFVGIGAGADLVEEGEISAIRVRERRDDVAQMGREGGERLGDRLLVADVGEDLRDDRHSTSWSGGDLQAACGHHREQTDGLEGDRLTAGVRAGDDKDGDVAAEPNVDSDDTSLLHQERMARVDEIEDPVGVQRWARSLERVGVKSLREREVQSAKRGRDRFEVVRRALDSARELIEDAHHLRTFRELSLAEHVVRLEDL